MEEELDNIREEKYFFSERNIIPNENFSFAPKISNKSKKRVSKGKNISEYLFNGGEPSVKCNKSNCKGGNFISEEEEEDYSKFFSRDSKEKVIEHFVKEFVVKLKEVNPNNKKIQLFFLELVSLLKKMSFLKEEKNVSEKLGIDSQKYSNDEISKEIWNYLGGNIRKYITSSCLLILLAGIMNLK